LVLQHVDHAAELAESMTAACATTTLDALTACRGTKNGIAREHEHATKKINQDTEKAIDEMAMQQLCIDGTYLVMVEQSDLRQAVIA
jgi:chemotaxis regulatin CheY-phosphate phosphatase CheZ